MRPYTADAYTDDTMTVHQVPIFGQSTLSGQTPGRAPGSPDGHRAPDASLVVAFVCQVNKCAAPVGSVENLLSPSSPHLAAASPQERKLPGASGQRAGFARVSVSQWGRSLRPASRGRRLCSAFLIEPGLFPPIRGTAAIGPLIAALKNGRSVTYEGREVRHHQAF